MTVDELDDFLDRYAGRASTSPYSDAWFDTNTDELTATAREFYVLDAAEDEPEPDPLFVRRLGEHFTMNTTLHQSIDAGHTPALPHVNGWFPPVKPDRIVSRPHRFGVHLNHLAIVLLALLAVSSAIAALLWLPGSPPEKPPTFAAAVGTPVGVDSLPYQPIDIADCATTARAAGTVRNLYRTEPLVQALLPRFNRFDESATPSPLIDPATTLSSLPQIEPAAETEIVATLHQLTACRFFAFNYGEQPDSLIETEYDGRFYALYSDDFFRRELGKTSGTDGIGLINAWIPAGPEPLTLDDARTLPDGRVIGLVSESGFSGYSKWLVVFAGSDHGWLVDEIASVPVAETPNRLPYGQYLEVVLRDREPSRAIPFPSQDAFVNNRPVTITLANLGSVDQEFRIDSLSVLMPVPAGHSVSFTLTPPAGLYVAESYVPDPINPNGRPLLRLQAVIRIVDEGTPVGMG